MEKRKPTYEELERRCRELEAQDETLLKKLIDILQHPSETVQDFLDYALGQAIEMTGSKIGYIFDYNEDRREFVLNTWSKDVMPECAVKDITSCYALDNTGVWGEAVRQRKPIVINDFQAPNPLKKGYPEGHVHLAKFMTVPIFKENRIVGVIGLGNKETDYTDTDVLQTSLLIGNVWMSIEGKKTEDALRESEEKYRTLVDNAEEGIFVAQDGILKFANRYLADMLEGYTEQELTSLPFSTFIHPDDRDMVFEYHNRRLKGEAAPTRYNFRAFTRGGVTKWVEISTVLIEWNGRPASLHFLTDITVRKKAEDALRESEHRFRSFVENANDIVYTLSPQGIFTYVSPNWLDLVGEPAEEATGKFFETYVHPDDLRACRDSIRAMLTTGEKQNSVEYRVIHHDGSWRWHLSNGSPLREEDGSITSFVGIARDVTDRKRTEDALRESEHRFRSFIENANDIVYTLSPQGIFTYVSPNWLDSLGVPAEKVTGKFFGNFVHPDDVPVCHNFLEKVLTTGEKQSSVEYRVIHADGSWRWHVSNGSPLRGEDGSVTSYIGIARDVTDRKRTEFELQKQSEAMEASIDGMAILDKNEIYTYVNTAFAFIYGYRDPEELLGKSWRSLYDPDGIRQFEQESMSEFRRNGKWSGEAIGKKKDGSLFPLDISLTVLQGGGLICLVRDATARKHAEIELQRQKNLLQKIFDILPVGLWFIDKNGIILSRNAAGTKIWGTELYIDPLEYKRFKARRLPSGEEIAPDDWALQHTIREGVTIEDELLEIDAFDGKKRVILNSTAPVFDEQGEIQGAIGVNQDITEYQKLQKQLIQSQKMESVGRLAGGVAHDFNNMLAVVLGNVQFALEQTDPSLPLYKDLKEIEKAAERSVSLTRQLLAFARRQTAEPKILDLNEKVEGTISMLERLIGEDINLVWKPGKDLPNVYIDPSQIDQVLANLCVNARDAIHDVGTIIIESGTAVIDEEYCDEHEGFTPGEYVMLSVSDDGSGMDKSILSNIFDPFFTTKEQGKGTGLGLATVYGIVKQNNGFINVYSEKGQGTTFKIYLPRYYSESQELESNIPSKKVYTGSETILLVEDEPQLLELSRKFLKKLGYEAITASSPTEAIRIVGDYPGHIHLLITDIVMPEMNGRDLARRLRASCPEMKFLFMSGYTADVIAHHGVLEDGVQFIQKPFSLHDFSAKIKETLKEE